MFTDQKGRQNIDSPDFVRCIVEAVSDKIDWLVRLIVVRLDRSDIGVESLVLALGRIQGVLQLAERGEKTGAIRANAAISLLTQPELDGEPVHLFNEGRRKECAMHISNLICQCVFY